MDSDPRPENVRWRDLYGSWVPVEAPGAVNVLAEGLDLDRPGNGRGLNR